MTSPAPSAPVGSRRWSRVRLVAGAGLIAAALAFFLSRPTGLAPLVLSERKVAEAGDAGLDPRIELSCASVAEAAVLVVVDARGQKVDAPSALTPGDDRMVGTIDARTLMGHRGPITAIALSGSRDAVSRAVRELEPQPTVGRAERIAHAHGVRMGQLMLKSGFEGARR